MPYLRGPAGDLEREFEEGGGQFNEDAIVKPGDDNYDDVRARLIDACDTPEERDAVYERYPHYDPEQAAAQIIEENVRVANRDRTAALEAATTEAELDEVYKKFPMRGDPSLDAQAEAAYREAVKKAETPEELDAVYREFDKPPVSHS